MIYLEDYDLPIIALNVNMFMAGLLFIFTDTLWKIIDMVATDDTAVFWFGSSLLSILATLLLMLMVTVTILVDLWWMRQKGHDNRRWL